MTRFARAKGSKASNERRPEEATSWQDMRKQLEANQTHKEVEKADVSCEVKSNWKQKILIDSVREQNENSVWTNFSEGTAKKNIKKKKIKSKQIENPLLDKEHATIVSESYKKISEKNENVGTKRKTDKSKEPVAKKIKRSNIKDDKLSVHPKQILNVEKKDKNVLDKHGSKPKYTGNLVKNKKHINVENNIYKRRKPNPGNYIAHINGKNVEIVCYEGFFIKKEDAQNLSKLRKQFIKKGIPQKELQAIMKLERRKAEKALARDKKKVCFQCRKSGHNLSECPDLQSNGSSTSGICFKCGSTEHTYFECKVSRGEDFRFAQCFICKEEGHIAKQCPDNPRGLYPKGGACRICGDVTHLKKDCPDLKQKAEENSVTAQKFNERSVESLDEELRETGKPKKQPNKKIKFF